DPLLSFLLLNSCMTFLTFRFCAVLGIGIASKGFSDKRGCASAGPSSGSAPLLRRLDGGYPILVDLVSIGPVRPIWLRTSGIVRRLLQAGTVEVHAIPSQVGVVGQCPPR